MTNCLNCEEVITPDHQCDNLPTSAAISHDGVSGAVGTKVLSPRTGLIDNAVKSELAGEIPPLSLCPKTVKCHPCAYLGRETSLVLCGSVCPSCGVTAVEMYYN